MSDELDLGELPVRKPWKRGAYPARPGSGPEGKRCKDCAHFRRKLNKYSKCGLVATNRAASTDISMYAEACRFFESDADENRRS